MQTFKIPVTWQMAGVVEIEAETLAEAQGKAVSDTSPLPNGEYISDSIEIDFDSPTYPNEDSLIPWHELIVYESDGNLVNNLELFIKESYEHNLPINGKLFLKEDGSLDYWEDHYLVAARPGEIFDNEVPVRMVDWSGFKEFLLKFDLTTT